MSQFQLAIEHLPTAMLRPYARNARTHSPKQIAQIAASIREFGFNNPVLIDRDGEIIAGHGRVEAAKKLGLDTVPCVRLEHLTEAQKRAYILADNQLAEKAGWDREILAIELQHLTTIDLDFDVTLTGFEMAEIDLLLGAGQDVEAKADPADAVPEVETGPAVTRLGDIWQIGRHRLICGDATRGRDLRPPACRREGADGLHRSAVQREDRRSCLGARHAPSTASSPWPPAR